MRNKEKEGKNKSLNKVEQVWREIFPPKIGDWVEFVAQYRGKHKLMGGYVKSIQQNSDGSNFYTIRVTYVIPPSPFPKYFRLKGNLRLRRLEREPVI